MLVEPGSPANDAGRVGAVVVNHNARDVLLACVRSLRAEGVRQVVVADNASVDGSAGALAASDPDVVYLASSRNAGYGAGANRGMVRLGTEMVLVCNPDLVVHPGAIARLTAALDADPRLAFVGPRLENPDGSLYPSARSFPSLVDAAGHAFLGLVVPGNRFSRRYKLLDWDHAGARQVDWVSGACFLARRQALEALGGFDESYFMYLEDVDLCWRAGQAGWRVSYQPAAVVTHEQGVSTNRHPYRMILAHHCSILRFAWRTTTGPRRLLLPLVAVGLVVRVGLAWVQRAAEAARRPANGPAAPRRRRPPAPPADRASESRSISIPPSGRR